MNRDNNEILVLENNESEFSYKRNKSNLNITFNRIAFIYFVFFMISIIYSIKVFYLGSLNSKIKEKTNLFKLINKKPITPSIQEIKENPPSRSAKLRFDIKEKNILNFKTDILDKFNYLIEIENYSEKL